MGIQAGFHGGIMHEDADGVVSEQVTVGLLMDAFWERGSQNDTRPTLVDLELIQGGLEALSVESGQFPSRSLIGRARRLVSSR